MKYYDISVIIPIYNCEKYIRKSLKSLINQNYDFRKIEVLLINDGSTDKSLEICESFSKKYSNIKVFSHENRGVSYTRNIGLMNATGAYITFLDSDDYLSNSAIKCLVDFFDKHNEEIDIVTYSMVYDKKGKLEEHPKNKIFNKTGVYNANDLHYFPMSTINVVIKNKKKKNLLFDETLKVHEDCNHNIKQIMQKEKFGFCKEAVYYYVKHEESASSNIFNPYYIFDDWINLCEHYINKYSDNGKLKKYLQMSILYEFNWKLTSNILFPTYMNQKDYKIAENRIINVLKYIDDETILKNPFVDKMHKHYFISLKNNKINVEANNKEVVVFSNDVRITASKEFQIVITKFKVINNKLNVIGFFKSQIFNYIKPKFIVKNDGFIQDLNVKLSTHSNYKVKVKTNNFYRFDITYDINDINELEFYVQINNINYPTKFYFMPNLPINNIRKYIIKENNKIEVINNQLIKLSVLTNSSLNNIKTKEKEMYSKINKKIVYFRGFSNKLKNKIWLYNDKEGVIDNGYYQFKHDIKKKDGIKRYYVSRDSKSFLKKNFNKKELKYVVQYQSLKHKILFLNADKILTSFRDLEMYSPFINSYNWYNDLLNFEVIYLQHGILHCHTPWIYSKEANLIDKVVISSNFEYNNFIDNYNYLSQDLIMSGMPRLDINKSIKEKNRQKRILIALSWRINLMGEYKNGMYAPNNSKYLKSEYYKEVNDLLNSKKFNEMLKKENIICDFMPHPIFRVYTNLFNLDNSNIEFIKNATPSDYDLIITDYSSIVFDYVYAGVPVMYFVPDYDLYKAGITHIYNKLDLPMEEGFGPFTTTQKDLLKELEKFVRNNYKLDKKYEIKSKNFFISKDNHSENLYLELMDK